MADVITRVAGVCSDLRSEKITVRKEAARQLEINLNKTGVLRALDENTDGRKKNAVTWDYVFQSAVVFFRLELDVDISKYTASYQIRKKEGILRVIRLVIEKADGRGPRLKGQELGSHILTILKDPVVSNSMGLDYCKMLSKSVLSVPVHRNCIGQDMWQEFINFFMEFILNLPQWLPRDRIVVAVQIFQMLLSGASALYTLKDRKLFQFFTRISWNEISSVCLDDFLSSLNCFVGSAAEDCRGQVCCLGEDLFPVLMQIWRRSQQTVKDQLIQFMKLQMCLHHPLGTRSDAEGAWCSNISHWKKCLEKLYQAILNDIHQSGKRVRTAGAKMDPGFRVEFIELAADVTNQVFWAHSFCTVEAGTELRTEGFGSSKRRKLASGWPSVREALEADPEGPVLLTWLRILTSGFSRHPCALPEDQFVPVLSSLLQRQGSNTRSETSGLVLKCLEAFAGCFAARKKSISCSVVEATSGLLKDVWLSTLRRISGKSSADAGYSLLSKLLKERLVEPDVEIWKILCTGNTPPSRTSLEFLAVFLQSCVLHENLQLSDSLFSSSAVKRPHPLRHHLLEWLLPLGEMADDPAGFPALSGSKAPNRLPSVEVMAGVLVSLTQRVCQTVEIPAPRCVDSGDPLDALALLFLRSSFDERNVPSVDDDESQTSSVAAPHDVTIELLRNLMLHRLAKIADQLSEPADADTKQSTSSAARDHAHSLGGRLECHVRYCCLVTNVLTRLLRRGSLSRESLKGLPVVKKLELMLKKIANGINEIILMHSTELISRMDILLVLFKELEKLLLSVSSPSDNAAGAMRDILREHTPARLLNDALEIYNAKWCQSPHSRLDLSGEGPATQNSSLLAPDQLDGFDDFESDTTMMEESVMDPVHSQSKVNPNTTAHLSLRKAAAQFLSCWCCPGGGEVTSLDLLHPANIRDKMIELFRSEDFRITREEDLQLFFAVAFSFAAHHQDFPPWHLEILMDVLREAMSVYRKDQNVCVRGLQLLTELAPCFGAGEDPAAGLQKARDIGIHIVRAFWSLRNSQYSCRVKLQLAKCIVAFIKVDPEGKWSNMKQMKRDSGGSADSTPQPLFKVFPELLADCNHSVRMCAARAVGVLFTRLTPNTPYPMEATPNSPYPMEATPKSHQAAAFELVSQMLVQSLFVEPDLSREESEDEGVNRSCSTLSCLKRVCLFSPVCEKRAVALVFQAIKEQFLDRDLVTKVLGQLAEELGYSSRAAYIEAHLGFIVENWLNVGFKITDFPYQLLDFSTAGDFFRHHHAVVLAHVISRPDTAQQSIEMFTKEIGSRDGCREYLRESFCAVIACLVPWFAVQSRKGDERSLSASQELERESRSQQASRSHELLLEALKPEKTDKIMAKKFDELVVELLLRMHEPPVEGSDVARFSRESDPEPNPPHFTSFAIKATLDYLTRCHGGASLVSVLCKAKGNIQKILLSLSSHIARTHLKHEKRRVLSMYRLFVRLVLNELSSGLNNTWAFFLRDVIHSLTRIIGEGDGEGKRTMRDRLGMKEERELFLPCCDLLWHVCEAALLSCSQELGSHLRTIVSSLVPYAAGNEENAAQALRLLRFLIVENKVLLMDAIAQLDPFPETPPFRDLNEVHWELKQDQGPVSLEQEIRHFIAVSRSSSPLSRPEGLRQLRHQLITNKHNMLDLFHHASDTSTRPDVVRSLVHELVCLAESVSPIGGESANNVKCEIANCLGEIGAIDLSSVALGETRSQEIFPGASEVLANDPTLSRNSTVVAHLNTYLIDKSVDVVAASAACLKQVLCTDAGGRLLKLYERHKAEQLVWYLEPFRPPKKKKICADGSLPQVSEEDFLAKVGVPHLWLPGVGGVACSHDGWITRLTDALIGCGAVTDPVLRLMGPVCAVKVEFAELVFPFVIHDILVTDEERYRGALSEQIRGFFSHCNNTSVLQSRAGTPLSGVGPTTSQVSKRSIRTMLSVVTYLRTQPRPAIGRAKRTPWDNNFWLELDYLEVAQAAQKCSAHFTALLYMEIWADIQKSNPVSRATILLPSHSQDTVVSDSSERATVATYQSLLLDAYSCIGEPDCVYGAGAGRLADTESRIKTYEHEQAWGKALRAYDRQMAECAPSSQAGLLKSLKNFGLDHVMRGYLASVSIDCWQSTGEIAELQYEAAWRTCVWDLDTNPSDELFRGGFHQSIHSSLCALRERETDTFRTLLDSARLQVIDDVAHVGVESVRSVYPALVRLQCIVELEQFGDILTRRTEQETQLVSHWKDRFPLPETDFEFLEPVLALRTTMLQMLLENCRTENNSQGPDAMGRTARALRDLVVHREIQAKLARQANSAQVAEKAISAIRHLQSDLDDIQCKTGLALGVSWTWRVEEAKMHWALGDQETAMHLLKLLNTQLGKIQDVSGEAATLYPQTLGLYGSWLEETRSENPSNIVTNYLEKAACLLELMEDDGQSSRIEAFLCLARFADTQYQNSVDYMKSSTYENKQALTKKAKGEYQRLEKHFDSVKDRYVRALNLQIQMDEEEERQKINDQERFLQTALENYAKALQAGDTYDLRIFRLCSLWFDNANQDFVNRMIKDSLYKIHSRKFLPLMYQLAARLGTRSHQNELFQTTLNEIIERTALDHPHHTLFILLALANADKDEKYLSGTRKAATSRLTRKPSKGVVEMARIQAAKNLIGSIAKQHGTLVQGMEKLCDAYIELAYEDVSHLKTQRGPFNFPERLLIRKIANLKEVPVATSDVKVDPLCRYEDIVYVSSFECSFCLAGGVNLPKIIKCVGSDGLKRRQLVKGRDDLRQDAVMEQVFGMVNQLLVKNADTRKRKLKIRTYKVIPLSQRSGIVEWCEDTVPLGEYLVGRPGGTGGAHKRYHPDDWTSYECRTKIAHGDQNRLPRLKVYQEVMAHFKPVFRHFFLEKFPDPSVWFERRLAYTRSAATSSIVGYVVGLGDRHVQNILVDCNTAELVHIDLGVAFEQGKILPTPETVPFRLTRDLVDAMGLSGVEGVFRRCCQKTMEVMRTSHEALVTIIEVLLYDPLHSWTLNSEKIKALQRIAEQEISDVSVNGDMLDSGPGADGHVGESHVNKMAERVLLRVKQKLDGVEEGVHLSVSGQVNLLIRQAIDVNNLCRLFPGWQPWV